MYQFITVKKDNNEQVTLNFKLNEFFSKEKNFLEEVHDFDQRTIFAAQRIRDFFNVPLKVFSTVRTASLDSAHGYNCAADLHVISNQKEKLINDFWEELNQGGELFHDLSNIGVTGVGVYAWGVHVDTWEDFPEGRRQERFNKVFGMWDKRESILENDEDEATSITDDKKSFLSIAVGVIVMFWILWKNKKRFPKF